MRMLVIVVLILSVLYFGKCDGKLLFYSIDSDFYSRVGSGEYALSLRRYWLGGYLD